MTAFDIRFPALYIYQIPRPPDTRPPDTSMLLSAVEDDVYNEHDIVDIDFVVVVDIAAECLGSQTYPFHWRIGRENGLAIPFQPKHFKKDKTGDYRIIHPAPQQTSVPFQFGNTSDAADYDPVKILVILPKAVVHASGVDVAGIHFISTQCLFIAIHTDIFGSDGVGEIPVEIVQLYLFGEVVQLDPNTVVLLPYKFARILTIYKNLAILDVVGYGVGADYIDIGKGGSVHGHLRLGKHLLPTHALREVLSLLCECKLTTYYE